MTASLTIDNFEFDKLRAKSPETKKGGNVTYYSIPFEYEDRKSLLRLRVTLDCCLNMKTRRELATLWQLELTMRMRNSLLNWGKNG